MSLPLWGQPISRSGLSGDWDKAKYLRRFPCGGTTVQEITFDNFASLPTDWQVIDVDGQTPSPQITNLTPTGGWQLVDDFNDTTSNNKLLVSPSWYTDDSVASDDWLILPQQSNLPSNVCLSWFAFSQDAAFKEAYEVWISTSGNTIADFQNGTQVFITNAEENFLNFQSVSLAQFAGQDIYIAFHHISANEFLLGLDDIRLAQVNERDLAVQSIDDIRVPINTNVTISGSIINQGLDTLSFDSAGLKVFYQIDQEDPNEYEVNRAVVLLPNDTVTFAHDSVWVPTDNRVYVLRVWFEAVTGDQDRQNDTLFRFQGIGSATDIEGQKPTLGFSISPNPATDQVVLQRAFMEEAWTLKLMQADGRVVRSRVWPVSSPQLTVETADLARGLYLLAISNPSGISRVSRLIIR